MYIFHRGIGTNVVIELLPLHIWKQAVHNGFVNGGTEESGIIAAENNTVLVESIVDIEVSGLNRATP